MGFHAIVTGLPPVLLIRPDVFEDDRGYFLETYSRNAFSVIGIEQEFVQDNHSYSKAGVLRGIHYQVNHPQGKLVRVVSGEIYDVAVDLRRGADTFGKWTAEKLSAQNRHMLWVPPGFGHAFLVLSSSADVIYKVTAHYSAADDRCVRWDDPDLAIDWPLPSRTHPELSSKDSTAPFLREAAFS